MAPEKKKRCDWAGSDPLYVEYHDSEWGVPVHDDRKLFEFLTLEGAQAGLSWLIVLRKRESYRKAFQGFDVEKIAGYGKRDEARLMADPGVVRHPGKIAATIGNAQAFLRVVEEFGSFDAYQWRFVDGKPLQNRIQSMRDIPTHSDISDAFSKDLKKRGFKFVGTTILYAYMQAVGMVNDHLITCFREKALRKG
jgi:DNA-3-methyladenine glycosylase I